MAQDAATLVTLRNAFYRDNYRRVAVALMLSMLLNLGLSGILFYLITHPPLPKYFATSVAGRITPLFPLDSPNQSDRSVLQWASQVSIAVYSYNFVNYREELAAASEFFTSRGWNEFQRALKNSNTIDAVVAKKLIVSSVVTRAPVILEKGLLRGRWAWRVQMPISVTYQSASEFAQESYVVTMLVVRMSTLNSPKGIGVEQIVFQPTSGVIQ